MLSLSKHGAGFFNALLDHRVSVGRLVPSSSFTPSVWYEVGM